MTGFRLVALPHDQFAPLFDLSDAELGAMNARRETVDHRPGFPCRVSLADAEVGETVLLLPFVHHDVQGPYRASGPIYVRQGARTARPAAGEIPLMFRHRLLSLRAYDPAATLVKASVVNGTELEGAIAAMFADQAVGYLHIHNASPGCFTCLAERA
jgi:hypothetical protein